VHVLALAAVLICAEPERLPRPGDALPLMAADIASRGLEAPHLRYLWMGQMSPADRPKVYAAVSFVSNMMSTEPNIRTPRVVDAQGLLLAVDLRWYGWSAEAWDQLAAKGSGPSPRHDPWYTLEVIDQQGQRFLKPGVWFDRATYKYCEQQTGTVDPVLEARWFVAYAATTPSYHRFLGLKAGDSIEAWWKLVAVDPKGLNKGRTRRAVQVDSGVTLHNRLIEFMQTAEIEGTYWRTYDYFDSADKRSLLENPLLDTSDAGEHIATLPNGLQAYALTDAAEKLIDSADADKVAQDDRGVWKNPTIRSGIRCAGCHGVGKADGIRDFYDSIRATYDSRSLKLLTPSEKDYRRLLQNYTDEFSRVNRIARDRYRDAVAKATGMSVAGASNALERVAQEYSEGLVTRAMACRDLGLTEQEFLIVVERMQGLAPATVSTLIRGGAVKRLSWETVYGIMASAMVVTEGVKK
jgi:hypothetical protein